MIDNILTNYNVKFKSTQMDSEKISKTKQYYKIYNNKIQEPLHKFWFSVQNLKYSNSYSDFKTIRLFMNNKSDNISNLVNFIKDLSNCMLERLKPTFENISIDYPWKESEQYPYLFTFFTNNETLMVDTEGNETSYDTLSLNETYSIIFEISSLKIISIKLDNVESYVMKINLVLILIRQDEKKDIKKYLFTKFVDNNEMNNLVSNPNINLSKEQRKLPFLQSIGENIQLTSIKNKEFNLESKQSQIQTTNKLIVNTEEILKAINGLKKVNVKKEQENKNDCIYNNNNEQQTDNCSQINTEYLEKKNSLKKVKTKERSLLKTLQKKNKKNKKDKGNKEKDKKDNNYKKNIIDIDNEDEDLDKELEMLLNNNL